MAGGTSRDGRRRRVAGRVAPRAERAPVGGGAPEGLLTVQLLPHHLAAGDLPRMAVGDVVDVAPAIYAGALDGDRDGPDRFRVDEFGCLEARGTVIPAMLDPASCECRVDVLDTGGRLFPLNPAATPTCGEAPDGRVEVEGALYLDPELAPGTPHGNAVVLCRRRYRVVAVRRYRRTPWRPADPVALAVVPAPGEIRDAAVYVADLRVADEPDVVPALRRAVAEGSARTAR